MDFLNKAFAQFNDLFRSMTPGGRITAGLLLIVAVVSVGYLFQSQVGGGDDYLFGGASFSTPTLQKMEEAFGEKGLNGFSIDGGRVKVPHAQRAAYLGALADSKAMPQNPNDMFEKASTNNLFADPRTRERDWIVAKQQEMSLAIGYMKGIERASVLIDAQNQNGLSLAPLKTASVSAQAIGSVPLDDEQVDKIRYYVAASVAGMKPENVTIVDANGPVHPGREASEDSPGNDIYERTARREEQRLNAKVREALSYIQNLTVISTVTLDHDKGSRSVEIKNGPKPITVLSSEESRTTSREAAAIGGAPGLAPQGGGANQAASVGNSGGKGTNEQSDESKSHQLNALDTTSTETEKVGLTPKLAKVSVGIPSSYFEKVWQDRNPVKPGEEAKKPDPSAIEAVRTEITKDVVNHVATLLPPAPEVKDPTSLVTVTTFQDIKAPEIPGPPATQKAMLWLGQNWPMMAMVGLVLFSLNMLRSMLRSAPAPSAESATLSARVSSPKAPAPQDAEDSVEVTAARRLHRITGSGPSLRDELSEFVKEDPDSAANILRSWIGQVN